MDQGNGHRQVHRVYGFFLAPYPVNGNPNEGDPLKSPDVTSNRGVPRFGRLFG